MPKSSSVQEEAMVCRKRTSSVPKGTQECGSLCPFRRYKPHSSLNREHLIQRIIDYGKTRTKKKLYGTLRQRTSTQGRKSLEGL